VSDVTVRDKFPAKLPDEKLRNQIRKWVAATVSDQAFHQAYLKMFSNIIKFGKTFISILNFQKL